MNKYAHTIFCIKLIIKLNLDFSTIFMNITEFYKLILITVLYFHYSFLLS